MVPQMAMGAHLTRSEDLLSVKPGYAVARGLPVGMRHKDCRVQNTWSVVGPSGARGMGAN